METREPVVAERAELAASPYATALDFPAVALVPLVNWGRVLGFLLLADHTPLPKGRPSPALHRRKGRWSSRRSRSGRRSWTVCGTPGRESRRQTKAGSLRSSGRWGAAGPVERCPRDWDPPSASWWWRPMRGGSGSRASLAREALSRLRYRFHRKDPEQLHGSLSFDSNQPEGLAIAEM
jgi:hypothetical protein